MEKILVRSKIVYCFVFVALLMWTAFPSQAAESFQFQTKNTVIDAADSYVITKNASGKYGLLDSEGEEAIPFEYDEMSFPEDVKKYDYVIVKQGKTWGILDYEGNELVEVRYSNISSFENENTIAAGYDGNKTYLYNLKGKETGILEGKYSVISDSFFLGENDIKNENDKSILNLEEEGMFDSSLEKKTAHCLKLGENIVADYYFSGKEEEKDIIGKLKIDQYIKIFDKEGELVTNIKPQKSWTEDTEDGTYQSGGIKVVDVISDTFLEVQMVGFDDKYLIYNIEKEEFSHKFKKIGSFIEGRAFAVDLDGHLQVINESGKIITEDGISLNEYKREFDFSKNASFLRFKKKDKENDYRLYSLKKMEFLEDSYSDVIFKGGYYTIICKTNDYGVMDAKENMIVEYGKYEKKELEKAFYSDTSICIAEEESGNTIVHIYQTYEKEKDGFPVKIVVIIGVVIFIIIILSVILYLYLRKKKEEEEEEKREKIRQEERKRKEEKKKEQERRQRDLLYERERIKIIHQEDSLQSVKKQVFSGAMKGICGEYAGTEITIQPGEKLRIGRSRNDNDVVLQNTKVSRNHCVISYDVSYHKYRVTDLSSNGIYLENGRRLEKGVSTLLEGGTILYLGNRETAFELKREIKKIVE